MYARSLNLFLDEKWPPWLDNQDDWQYPMIGLTTTIHSSRYHSCNVKINYDVTLSTTSDIMVKGLYFEHGLDWWDNQYQVTKNLGPSRCLYISFLHLPHTHSFYQAQPFVFVLRFIWYHSSFVVALQWLLRVICLIQFPIEFPKRSGLLRSFVAPIISC